MLLFDDRRYCFVCGLPNPVETCYRRYCTACEGARFAQVNAMFGWITGQPWPRDVPKDFG